MKMKKVVRMPLRRAPQRTRPPAASSLRARAATADEAYDEEEDYDGEEEPNMNFWHAVLVVLILHFIAVAGIFAFNWIKANQTAEAKVAATAPAPAITESAAPQPATTTAAPKPVAEKPKTAAAVPDTTIPGWTGKTYAIQPGDTLTRVATQFGITIAAIEKENNITTYSTLRVGQVLKIPAPAAATETKPVAPVPRTLTSTPSGTVATVPKPATSTASPVPKASVAPKPAAAASTSGDVYVVAKGDNPVTIAKKLHVSEKALLELNAITDPTKLQIGQKLKIPQKAN